MKKFLNLFVIFALFLNSPEANAVYGGEDALFSERVVAIFNLKDSRVGGCSGSLISPRIVLTAAHCVAKPGNYPGVLNNNHWGYWISRPGVDFKTDDISTRIQSLYVVIADGYTNWLNPATNENISAIDDIAFIFLKDPIQIGFYPKIANEEEVKRLKLERAVITHYGYGLSDKGLQTGRPKKVELKIRPRERSYELSNTIPENFSIITDETGNGALCGGDSGGPWYAQLDGKLLIVANTVGASGCNGPGSGTGGTFGTLVYQYESLLLKKWEYFQSNETSISKWQANSEAEAREKITQARLLGQYYEESTGCHATGVIGALQSNLGGNWSDVASALGWNESPVCPKSNPVKPWTIYNPQKGELLRWRIQALGQWEVFTSPFLESTSTFLEQKAAADKAAAGAVKIESAKKTSSIMCTKGKITKKVSGGFPKCPVGYKKK